MRYFLITLTYFAIYYSQESSDLLDLNNSKWRKSSCIGLCTEKTSVSTFEFSILKDINSQSDFYASIGSFFIFTVNYGVGYRYYFNSKHKPSFFSSCSFNGLSYLQAPTLTAVNFTFARSFNPPLDFINILPALFMGIISMGRVILPKIHFPENTKLNLGLVLSYSNFFKNEHELILLPLINLEVDF